MLFFKNSFPFLTSHELIANFFTIKKDILCYIFTLTWAALLSLIIQILSTLQALT